MVWFHSKKQGPSIARAEFRSNGGGEIGCCSGHTDDAPERNNLALAVQPLRRNIVLTRGERSWAAWFFWI
jgi:hypothetical protein